MEATKMRKMMVAASLMFAACGSSQLADDPGDGSGGSGDMDAGVPASCMVASDCESGFACDITTHECVAGALTIDPTDDVVVDGTRWWTAVSDPVVSGTFQGPASTTIEVTVGTASVAATLEGTTWSAKLPASSIAATDTWVTVTMTDPSGGSFAATQLFQLDDVAPLISTVPSLLRDERGDTIDFSTGEPVHTHAGPEIDLTGAGCPAVYKYAYLMAAQDPTFGRQTTQNPLAWNFEIREAKLTTTSYRVRNADNQVLVDWKALPFTNGAYRIELLASNVAALASYDGELSVDVLARDWTGHESTATSCIHYHALAAPLKVEAIQQADAPYNSTPALFSMSFAADSPVSALAGSGLGAGVASQRIVQYTAEPIQVAVKGAITNLRHARTYVDDYVAISTSAGSSCQAGCSWEMPADPADSTTSGPAQSWGFTVAVIDDATNTALFSFPPTIPARGPNDPPRSYHVVAFVSQLADLRPAQGVYPSEHTLNNQTYTGLAPSAPMNVCTEIGLKSINGEIVEFCKTMTTFKRMTALDHASLQWDSVAVDLQTRPAAGGTLTTPAHVPASAFVLGGMTWDSGDDDLPGVH